MAITCRYDIWVDVVTQSMRRDPVSDIRNADELKTFLMASRAAYNAFVCYHNFRHVVDVLQAVFFFLVQLGTLPPYPAGSVPCEIGKGPSIAALLRPFDALTLLISAIGHDVGHPGVNNAFLVALGAPLAQLYNDKSVLEAFHCAAYSQILRRYWKPAFEDVAMRSLMINTILATDMGVHFKYMTDLGNLQAKVLHDQGTAGWSQQTLDEYRTLTCGLLIKCADISNVVRLDNLKSSWVWLNGNRHGLLKLPPSGPTYCNSSLRIKG
jgi:3',5'-cyclic-nucleotide phosphodiesterase